MKKLLLLFGMIFCTIAVNAQDFFDDNESMEEHATSLSQEVESSLRSENARKWGARPRRGNTASYMYKKFYTAFPEGVQLGKDANSIVFTSPNAITAALPTNGEPKGISTGMIDPNARELSNTFVSNVLALTLSVRFDEMDPEFSLSPHKMGECEFKEGIMAGTSVRRLLDNCNAALAGQQTNFPVKVLNKMVEVLLASYQPGTIVNPILQPSNNGTKALYSR